jgi:hypothetical protein
MLRKEPNQRTDAEKLGAERGLNRFEGFSDAVFEEPNEAEKLNEWLLREVNLSKSKARL